MEGSMSDLAVLQAVSEAIASRAEAKLAFRARVNVTAQVSGHDAYAGESWRPVPGGFRLEPLNDAVPTFVNHFDLEVTR